MLNLASIALWLAPLVAPCSLSDRPDDRCSPGVIQTTDWHVICETNAGTRRVATEAMKRSVYEAYGVAPGDRWRYVIDDRLPVELGADNGDTRNLWPQERGAAHRKDVLENRVHRDVCVRKTMTVEAAQALFLGDWRAMLPEAKR